MTVFWIVIAVLLVGGLYLAWRTDHKNKARRAALQGQTPGQMHDVRGDVNISNVRGDHPGGGIITP
jgi:hypothetical protein